jgi:flavin-dependent dehydrogenase
MSEVLVAGGGPAGLAAAIAARQAGFEVSVFDSALPPIDKACGEGIMPDGLAALQRLGAIIPQSEACPFRGIRFVDNSHKVEAIFPNGIGFGIRRVLLHDLMTQRATALGVRLNWGTRVTALSAQAVEVEGRRIAFRWLICADGQNSVLREKSGLFPSKTVRLRYGFRRHYRVTPWTDFVEVHWSDGGQMYVTPIANDQVCVAFITDDLHVRFDAALPGFSKLAQRLRGAEIEGTTIGAVTASRHLPYVQSRHIALIGEAAGSVDAITGEGLSIAFHQAVELAAALRNNTLEQYQRAHRRIMRLPRTMSRLLLTLDGHPTFRRRLLRTLQLEPGGFDQLLAIHLGAGSVREIPMRQALRIGWKIMHA